MIVTPSNRMVPWVFALALAAPVLLVIQIAQAQSNEPHGMAGQGMGEMGQGMGEMCQCPMMNMGGGWMMAGMLLTGLLTIAAIATLVALTIFLLRRSHSPPH